MKPLISVELAGVARFIRGISFKPENVVQINTPNSIACMRTKNVQAELDLSDVWAVDKSFVRRSEQFLQQGDILVSSANSWNLVGKCCWIPELPWHSTFGGFVSVLRPDCNVVEPRFLFRWFNSNRIQATVRSFGQQTTNISNLNVDRCLKLPFPLPPLLEQQRIADVLDCADALRAKRRTALAVLSSLTQSIFLDMFGDSRAGGGQRFPEMLLSELTSVITKGTTPTSIGLEFAEAGIPFIKVQNLSDGAIDGSIDPQFITPAVHQKLGRSQINSGDLLISIAGTIGRVSLVDQEAAGEMNCNQAVALLRPNKGVDRKFLLHWLQGSDAQRQMRGAEVTGTISNLSLTQLRSLKVPLPLLTLQQEFSSRVCAVGELKAAQLASLCELNALFVSLQDRAFRGDLGFSSGDY